MELKTGGSALLDAKTTETPIGGNIRNKSEMDAKGTTIEASLDEEQHYLSPKQAFQLEVVACVQLYNHGDSQLLKKKQQRK